jgi:hypothetical protein
MTNQQDGLKKLADDIAKASPPRYCEAHKPCDAKEHQPGYALAKAIFVYIFGVLAWGCVLMLAVNAILAGWLDVVDTLSYGDAIVGTAGLYGLTEIRKGLG